MAQSTRIRIDSTGRILAAMLKENTGRHMLDSGGAYGRHWERNSVRDFETEPEASLSFAYGEVSVTLNLYHWLKARLTYDAKETAAFHRFANAECREDDSWLSIMQEWMERQEKYLDFDHEIFNSYNHEDMLSQVIQFGLFSKWAKAPAGHDYPQAYCILQIHGGCDVRGGYTRPRIFTVNGESASMLQFDEATIHCTACEAYWDLRSGGYHCEPRDEPVEVEDTEPFLPGISVPSMRDVPNLKDVRIYDPNWKDSEPAEPGYGVIVWDPETRQGTCPVCAKGRLMAYGPYPY